MAITYHAGRRIQGLTQDTSLDGTNDGCTTGVTGKLGNAWSFDGSNDKVTLTPTFSGKSAFTYSAWINPSSSSNHWAFPFYEGSGENPKVGIGLDYYNSNGLAYFYVSTASHSAISISVSNIPKGSWTHVTGVYDGSASSSDRLKFYINGSLVSSTLSGTPPTTIPTLGGDLYLGWYQANYWFNGLMDQTLFYDKALSASEISTIYNSGSGTTTPDTVGLFAHYNFEQTGNTLVNQVTAGDVKPTNVQVGSRYEETDTRKMYHYTAPQAATDDIFSTGTGWSGDTSTYPYNSTINGIGCDTSTLGEAVTKTVTTLSASGQWVLRFKVTRETGDLGDGVMINLGSSSASTSSLARMQNGNGLYPYGIHLIYFSNGNTVNAGGSHNTSFAWDSSSTTSVTWSVGDSRWIEVSHPSSSAFTTKVYSNANFTGTADLTNVASTSGQTLNYDDITIGTKWTANRKHIDFEDMQIWNGVTTAPASDNTWEEEGT
jgi:hypothetical protein